MTRDRKALLDRFEPLKRQFTGSETNVLTLRSNIDVRPGVANYRNGLLTITPSVRPWASRGQWELIRGRETMKVIFEESVKGTIKLIARQIEGATAMRETVTVGAPVSYSVSVDKNKTFIFWLTRVPSQKIFLSGGLSQSEYLFRRVQDWARNDPAGIEVKRPEEWYVPSLSCLGRLARSYEKNQLDSRCERLGPPGHGTRGQSSPPGRRVSPALRHRRERDVQPVAPPGRAQVTYSHRQGPWQEDGRWSNYLAGTPGGPYPPGQARRGHATGQMRVPAPASRRWQRHRKDHFLRDGPERPAVGALKATRYVLTERTMSSCARGSPSTNAVTNRGQQ